MGTKPRSVKASVPARPRFVVSKPPNLALAAIPVLGLAGALIVLAATQDREPDLAKQWGLRDPARAEAQRLTIAFAEKHSIGVRETAAENRSSNPDLEIEFKTVDWGIYFLGPYRYRIGYEAELTMIDNRTSRVVAHGKCRARLTPVRDYEEGGEDEDNFVREELKTGARQCAQDLGRRLLGVATD